jgi:hypothetical protein
LDDKNDQKRDDDDLNVDEIWLLTFLYFLGAKRACFVRVKPSINARCTKQVTTPYYHGWCILAFSIIYVY